MFVRRIERATEQSAIRLPIALRSCPAVPFVPRRAPSIQAQESRPRSAQDQCPQPIRDACVLPSPSSPASRPAYFLHSLPQPPQPLKSPQEKTGRNPAAPRVFITSCSLT